MTSSGLANPSTVDTPFSIGSGAGDLMQLLLRTIARGRDRALMQDPGEAVGAPAPSLGRSSAAMPSTMPPHMTAGSAKQPPQRPSGFAALHRRGRSGGHGTGGRGSGAGGVPGASMPHGSKF